MEYPVDNMEYLMIHLKKKEPLMHSNPYDALAIHSLHYANLIVGHYKMKRNYHIKRPAGTHDWLLILTLSGEGVVHHAGKDRVLKAGDLIAFMPATPHDYATNPGTGRWELLWVHFQPPAHWLPLLDWPAEEIGLPMKHLSRKQMPTRKVFDLFHELYQTSVSNLPLRDWLCMNLLESLLLHCQSMAQSGKETHNRLDALREYIHRNISSDLPLQQLSKEARLSVPHLCALFRQHLKTTPQKYIETYRMTIAKRLLMFANRSIKEVAYDVGYKDPLYFSKRFRSCTGLSPERYRETIATRRAQR